ncbi:unnamed protein product [Durusdinium trenchii]|uniref:Uncharacterized protein n=2 Tax=Durusdinium trenchii TaxID=1381693 RepID=A0ABP0LPY4_9DINO
MSVSADTPEEVDVPPPNRELLPRANYLAVQAEDLLSRCSKSIQSTDKNCFRARRRAELFLENRLLETEKSAKALREQASEVDYTIAIAERSLAKSIKRCLGKENLAKAMHSFFDPCSKHAERMQCIRSRNFTSSLRNCNCFFALFDPTSADLNAIPTCSEAGQRMPPSVSSKVDLANMLAECVWGLQQNGPEQLH